MPEVLSPRAAEGVEVLDRRWHHPAGPGYPEKKRFRVRQIALTGAGSNDPVSQSTQFLTQSCSLSLCCSGAGCPSTCTLPTLACTHGSALLRARRASSATQGRGRAPPLRRWPDGGAAFSMVRRIARRRRCRCQPRWFLDALSAGFDLVPTKPLTSLRLAASRVAAVRRCTCVSRQEPLRPLAATFRFTCESIRCR